MREFHLFSLECIKICKKYWFSMSKMSTNDKRINRLEIKIKSLTKEVQSLKKKLGKLQRKLNMGY